MEKLIEKARQRSGLQRGLETVFGMLMMTAGVVGAFYFELNTVLVVVLVGLGGVFFSKTKTLEALNAFKSLLPGVK